MEGVTTIVADTKILAGLISGGSIRKAAELCGCSVTTIRKRLAEPDFRAQYDSIQGELLTVASGALAGRLNEATAVLAEIMGDAAAPPGVRLQAADCCLRHAARYYGLSELERRLEALEGITDEKEL